MIGIEVIPDVVGMPSRRSGRVSDRDRVMPVKLFGHMGLRVSALCLGTMTFGEGRAWGADKSASRAVFERFVERGGNFIDTANNYMYGASEEFIGEFVAGRRERFVLGTKYSLTMHPDDPNGGGNHRKSLVQNLEESLRRLRTDYVDVYWLHAWDFLTPVDEIMRALDDVVRAGKVLYLGISDAPAWIVSYANAIARQRGWTEFSGLQPEYNLARRDAERDLLPMARAFDMTVTPWSPLANGLLTGKYNNRSEVDGRLAPGRSRNRLTERGLAIADAVVSVADEIGRTPAQVALAWLLHQPGSVIPLIGARRVEQLDDNLGCLDVELSAEQLERLDKPGRIDLGFPHDLITSPALLDQVHGSTYFRLAAAPRWG
jgi:aryl-alcohol dehydrogenase-like predicted oxidoreductase